MSSSSSSPHWSWYGPPHCRPHECCYPCPSHHRSSLSFNAIHCLSQWWQASRAKLEATNNVSTNDLIVDRPLWLCLWHYHSNLISLERRDWHSLDAYHSTFNIVQGIHFVLHQNSTHILTLVVWAAYAPLRESLPCRSNHDAVRDLIIWPARMMLTEPPQTVNLPYSASKLAHSDPTRF